MSKASDIRTLIYDGHSNPAIAERLGTSTHYVGRVRKRLRRIDPAVPCSTGLPKLLGPHRPRLFDVKSSVSEEVIIAIGETAEIRRQTRTRVIRDVLTTALDTSEVSKEPLVCSGEQLPPAGLWLRSWERSA